MSIITNEKIDINNLYDNVTYNYDSETRILYVKWDNNDKVIKSFMNEERTPYNYSQFKDLNTNKYNCFWVEELKKCISWEMGNKIHINIKSSPDGYFHICVCEYQKNMYIYEAIGEDGYLYINPYHCIFEQVLEKCNCVYNDLLDNGETPYVLK
jgi:hypothetical protein